MKKVIRIVLIILVMLVVLGIGGCAAMLHIVNDRNTHYYKYATPVGEIEKKYTPLGSYDVSYVEYEDENSRTGESSSISLDFLLGLNEDSQSDFYGKVNQEKIGIAGHSQGGVGAINAVTNQENGTMYKAIFAASTTSRYHADEMNKSASGWSCDPSKIKIPIFMVAGTNTWDAGNVAEYTSKLEEGEAQGICPLWWLDECYEAIPDDVCKIIARETGKDHGDMLRGADAYMTAWFMYWLQDDTEAGKSFVGYEAEITNNTNWQDVMKNR